MNYLDVFIAIPLIWGLYKGLSRGIIKELASLLGLALGVYGALRFSEQFPLLIQENTSIDESFIPIIAFAVTFLIIILMVRVVGLILDKIIKMVALGLISRVLGGVFGVLKMALITSALLLIVNSIDQQLEIIPKEQKKKALLYQPISEIVPFLLNEEEANSLMKEAEKVWEEPKETIPL